VIRAAAKVAVSVRCVRGIDGRGLHVTNLAALAECLERVACDGAICLSDGFRIPDCAVEHRAVVDGDAKSAAIAAASIVAKVTRDRYMHRADGVYSGWGFADHVGYSTPEHRDAITAIGISDIHRRSFQSVAYSQLALEAVEGGADPAALKA
jgi:ribonuclease HII